MRSTYVIDSAKVLGLPRCRDLRLEETKNSSNVAAVIKANNIECRVGPLSK
jgi:hypothetical protein